MTPATWFPGRKAARLLPAAAGKRCKRAGSEEGAEKIGRPGGGMPLGKPILLMSMLYRATSPFRA